MEETVLIGRGRRMETVSQAAWMHHVDQIPQHSLKRLSFMTEAHQRVRYFVVSNLVKQQIPVEPEEIARSLHISTEQVQDILEELERNLFFLVRNARGAVSWAYPVTVEPTPHRLKFSTGETLYAAWAEDAIAAPFVQGQLEKEFLSVEIETKCKHCDQEIHLTIDSNMQFTFLEKDASPRIFLPDVDWDRFAESSIIDRYWRNSVFFWSEEHAREYRANTDQVEGIYLTLAQCALLTPVAQGVLFAFRWKIESETKHSPIFHRPGQLH